MKLTYEELTTQLHTLGIPIAYRQWGENEAPTLPYLLFYRDESDDFMADNRNYWAVDQVSIELYTETKDFELETKLRELLESLEVPFKVFEGNLDSEQMYEVLFEIII